MFAIARPAIGISFIPEIIIDQVHSAICASPTLPMHLSPVCQSHMFPLSANLFLANPAHDGRLVETLAVNHSAITIFFVLLTTLNLFVANTARDSGILPHTLLADIHIVLLTKLAERFRAPSTFPTCDMNETTIWKVVIVIGDIINILLTEAAFLSHHITLCLPAMFSFLLGE